MTTDLATRTLTDQQIRQRIELNKQAGWGLEKGTGAQLNMVFLVCQKFALLPGDDITLYDGRPWITIDGRVKLMRRQPEYRGHSTRPLSREEREAWGYDPDDLVVEATIRTVTYGEIKARGKVSKVEREGQKVEGRRLNYVASIHPVEMAEKRALARAERFAFGVDAVIDDEDAEAAARTVIEERQDPKRVAADAQRYSDIFGDDESGTAYDIPREDRPAEARNARAELWQDNRRLVEEARKRGIEGAVLNTRSGDNVIEAANAELRERIERYEQEQAEVRRQKAQEGLR